MVKSYKKGEATVEYGKKVKGSTHKRTISEAKTIANRLKKSYRTVHIKKSS